jgi:hypothetical protein
MSGIALAIVGGTYGGLPAIGSSYAGGYFAGQISTTANGVATHNLVIAPKATGQANNILFKTTLSGGDPTSVIDGPANSAAMNSATYPAAQFCEGLTIGGFTDWYMPAIAENLTLYYFLKPTTDSNATFSGSTAYAVAPQPINTNYGLYTDPVQTSAVIFQLGGAEELVKTNFSWSSSQYPGFPTAAFAQRMYQGNVDGLYKTQTGQSVRAVRRVPL